MRFDSIDGYLSWDHDRLDGLLADVVRLVDQNDLAAAREAYPAFDEGLRRHIRIEEEILFPLFERKTGMTSGPTMVMREEHRIIQSALDRMKAALVAAAAPAFRDALATLESTLPPHNMKEENVLYPMTDQALSDEERSEVTARLVAA